MHLIFMLKAIMEEAERERKKIEEEQEEEEEEGETDEENDEDEEDVVVHLQLTQPDPGSVKDPTLQVWCKTFRSTGLCLMFLIRVVALA